MTRARDFLVTESHGGMQLVTATRMSSQGWLTGRAWISAVRLGCVLAVTTSGSSGHGGVVQVRQEHLMRDIRPEGRQVFMNLLLLLTLALAATPAVDVGTPSPFPRTFAAQGELLRFEGNDSEVRLEAKLADAERARTFVV
jgi:hypothetical protein